MTDEQSKRLVELQQQPHVRAIDRLAEQFPPELQQAFSDYAESVQQAAQDAVASWALYYIAQIRAINQRLDKLDQRLERYERRQKGSGGDGDGS